MSNGFLQWASGALRGQTGVSRSTWCIFSMPEKIAIVYMGRLVGTKKPRTPRASTTFSRQARVTERYGSARALRAGPIQNG